MKKEIVLDRTVNYEEMKYVICRTYSAGVFAGYLAKKDGKEVELFNARRLWYWDGAASLSQLSVDGVSKPENCKFPCEVSSVQLTEVIEILPVTDIAKKSIASASDIRATLLQSCSSCKGGNTISPLKENPFSLSS